MSGRTRAVSVEIDQAMIENIKRSIEEAQDDDGRNFYEHLLRYCEARPGQHEEEVKSYIRLYQQYQEKLAQSSATEPGHGFLEAMYNHIKTESKRNLPLP